MTKRFGRIYSQDNRDSDFLMVRKLAKVGTPLPVRKTWKIKPTALDQGDTGSCVGHAWANFLRAAPIESNAGADALRWKIYDDATQLDEWDDNDNLIDPDRQVGTSVRAGAQAVTNLGRLKSYLWAFDLQPTIEWVLTKGPVVLGTNWYSSMMRGNAAGLVTISPSSFAEGGHAYLCRGVNTKTAMALCCNSWGDSWNPILSGDFYLSFRDLERLLHEAGEAATAIEQKLKPAVA